MAYQITQHRRGTETEWLELNPVPYEGELIIVEFDNNVCKCKIGDNETQFSDLPYITDWLVAEFQESLEALQGANSTELNMEVGKLYQKIEDSINKVSGDIYTLQTSIDNKVAELASDISTLSADIKKVDDVVKALIDPAVGELDAKYSDELAQIVEHHHADKTALEETIAAKAEDLLNTVNIALTQTDKNLTEGLENIRATIASDYTSRFADTEEQLANLAMAVEQAAQYQTKVAELIQSTVTELTVEIDDKLNEKFTNSDLVTQAQLEELRADLNQINLAVEQLKVNTSKTTRAAVPEVATDTPAANAVSNATLLDLIDQVADLQHQVSLLETTDLAASTEIQKINNELIRLDTSLKNSLEQQKLSYEALLKNINALDEKLRKTDAEIYAEIGKQVSRATTRLNNLESDYTLLHKVVYKHKDELLGKFDQLGGNLQDEVNVIISGALDDIDKAKEDLNKQLADAQSSLEDAQALLRTEVRQEISNINNYFNLKTGNNEEAIKTLGDTVQTDRINLTHEIETLAADIVLNKADIVSNRTAISEVNSELDNKVTTINSDLEIFEHRLNRLDGRIDNIIAFEPFEEGDISKKAEAELKDIRVGYDGKSHNTAGEAVRAVGSDLQNLRNSLSQYIDTQAINGLYYDKDGEVGLGLPYYLYLKTGEEIIQDSGVRIISGTGEGPSGSGSTLLINYITPSSVVVTPKDKAILRFTFSGTDSAGDRIGRASAIWSVGGKTVFRGSVHEGENEFDVTDYINKSDITKVVLTVSDDSGASARKSWEVEFIELLLDSTFDDKVSFEPNTRITFSYTPTGATTKEAVFKLDGKIIHRELLESNVSGYQVTWEIPTQIDDIQLLNHGAHLLEVWLEATINDKPIPSNHIFKDILCYASNDPNAIPVIGTADRDLKISQYSTTNIVYTVYAPEDPTIVTIKVDGEPIATRTIAPNRDYGDTPTDIYSFIASTPGTHIVELVCGKTKKTINIFVDDIGVNISPITAGLAFDFNPAGKRNGDEWEFENINLTVSNNFDWVNGGYIPDDPDGPCFCIKAGSSATINYKLFENEAMSSGKEVKIVFKTKNVSSPDAIFLSCIDNTTDKDHIGLTMGVHTAHIYGKNGNLELAYSEEDVIEFEFNISNDKEAVPMVMGYEDGVPSRPMVYDSSYSFKQNTAKDITLGSPYCDLYIYRFKAYNTSLASANILKNYIADARTPEEMIKRYRTNQINNKAGKLTPESLAEACPWLRVIKISAPYFTSSKKDDIKGTVIQQLYGQGRKSDNWTAYDAVHSGQGTSSDNYGAAGRNIDLKVRIIEDENGNPINTNPHFVYKDENGKDVIVDKVSLTDTSIPVDYFNIKVNIASSNNLTNAIIAKHYNEFNPYRRPFVAREDVNTDYIKDTMEFYNCVVFIQETDADLNKHREFADTDWHFYAIGNIGDSKKTDDTRLTDPDDEYECCVEIMDVGLPLSGFPVDTMIDAMGYKEDEKTHERTYIWAKDENLGILYEAQFALTADTEINLSKTYYIDLPEIVPATAEQQTKENLENLYERLYVPTEDLECVKDKVYYMDATGTLATKEYLQGIDSPKDENLYEWRREYQKTADTEIIQNKFYYVSILKKTNAMSYTYEEVKNYLWAKDENLDILYEFINGEYVKTADVKVDLNKTYYTRVEKRDADDNIIGIDYLDAMGYTTEQAKVYTYANADNLDRLYEISYYPTTDTTVDLTKTYYVDILEHDDFSEDYTYGWRYISDDEDPEVVKTCKQAWIDFYRFVTRSTDAEFKAHFEDYFVKDSALYYYLFTTRYCMVDNRAKNTFWHYGKTSDGTRKWDLCWDYDNDTSLGLNNFGKQVYRYGLEDFDKDEAQREVFRQSDSLFFCRIRDLFASELKEMYQTLENREAWNADSFIAECDNWQEQFPEELWRIDIERKYIRTYNSSFITGKGDKQFLTNMANGKMKYHRRQWERNQEQYMASKYQTVAALGDRVHANFRVNRFDSIGGLAVVPNYQFTLTPYSYTYLNVQYGGTSPVQVRAEPNIPKPVPFSGTLSADIINVGSAASIKDFGDLSALYPFTASLQNATRVTTLKLGSDAAGYDNAGFSTLELGNNSILEKLDITNISSYKASLNLESLINLKKLYASGTNLPGVLFAEGGKLDYAKLPAVNSLILKNLAYLLNENLIVAANKDGMYDSVVELTIEGCPQINQLSIFEHCPKLNSVKLDNVQFGTKTYDYFETKVFKIADATIAGTVHIESLDGAQFNNIKKRYPKLEITYDYLTSKVKFMDTADDDNDPDVLNENLNYEVINEQNPINAADCVDLSTTEGWVAPIKAASQEFTYSWFGWSEDRDIVVNYELLTGDEATAQEQEDYNKYRVEILKHIEGDRVLYPVFKVTRNAYTVRFINPTDGNKVLFSIEIPYGSPAEYIGEDPKKLDVPDNEAALYEFTGWEPKPDYITGPLDCYAQFAYDDDIWYTVPVSELAYTTNSNNGTMAIIMYTSGYGNKALKTSNQYVIDGTPYTVTVLGGVHNFAKDSLQLFKFPEKLVEISAEAFKGCSLLVEVDLPRSLQKIGTSAFSGCASLKEVYIPANVAVIGDQAFLDCTKLATFMVDAKNNKFYTVQEGKILLSTSGKVIKGLSGCTLTSDMTFIKELADYCFAGTNLETVDIPSSIEIISSNAFSRCSSLNTLVLPNSVKTLAATCFAWCSSLSTIQLPSCLQTIKTFAFNSCPLTDVVIPASVETIEDGAFAKNTNLKTVRFEKRLKADGTVYIPNITAKAFEASGDSDTIFYVPWSEGQTPAAPWGASGATVYYEQEV